MLVVPGIFMLAPLVALFWVIVSLSRRRKKLVDTHPYLWVSLIASFVFHCLFFDFCGGGNDAFICTSVPVWYVVFGIPSGLLATFVWRGWRRRHEAPKVLGCGDPAHGALPASETPLPVPVRFPYAAAVVLFLLSAPSVPMAYEHTQIEMYGSRNCGLARLVDLVLLRCASKDGP
jgi:hypothetical protein